MSDELAEPMTAARLDAARDMVTSNVARAWGLREIDLTRVMDFLDRKAVDFPPLPSALPPAFVVCVHAACQALIEVPILNSRWTGEGIRVFHDINIGLETPTGRGRVVPVIRNADRLALGELAKSLARAAGKAVDGTVRPSDCEQGTFTVGFGGAYGAALSRPMLHDGQAGIFHLGTIRRVPRVIDNAIAIRSVSNANLAFDHRILDGSTSSRFQNLVKSKLESWSPDIASNGH